MDEKINKKKYKALCSDPSTIKKKKRTKQRNKKKMLNKFFYSNSAIYK
jgi:hypothetical protein